MNFFTNLDVVRQGVLICLSCLFISLFGMLLLRKIWPQKLRTTFTHIHGHMFGVIGIVYAVLIGAIAVGSWEKFKTAELIVFEEATTTLNMYHMASSLGPAHQNDIKNFIQRYVDEVVEVEWPEMQKGIRPNIKSNILYSMNQYLSSIHIENKTQEIYLPILVHQVNKLEYLRGQRVFIAGSTLNTAILVFMLLGGLLVILTSILFGLEHSLGSNALITSMLSLVIGLVITVIIGLDHPYQGEISISLDPLKLALSSINKF